MMNSVVLQIYLNERVHQKVRSSSRCKALLHDMDLYRESFHLGIHSLSENGEVSEMVFAKYDLSIWTTLRR